MHEHHQDIFDVIIAGAGPVGLFLACELRLFDLSVLVLEQAEHSHSSLKRLPSGMRGLSAPTLEAFYRRGLLDEPVRAQYYCVLTGSSRGQLKPPLAMRRFAKPYRDGSANLGMRVDEPG